MKLKLKLHPQAWVNDYAIDVDAEGETTWEVEWPEGVPIPEDDSHESDVLAWRDEAPEWVRNRVMNCDAPFWIEVLNRDEVMA